MIRSSGAPAFFALSLACLILYFHYGFLKAGVPVRLLGLPLAAAASLAAIKWRWEEKLPKFRSRSENALFSAIAVLFLAGQLYLLTVPNQLWIMSEYLRVTGIGFEHLPGDCYRLGIFLVATAGWYAVKRLFLLVWRQVEEPVGRLWRSLDRFDAILFLLGILIFGTAVIICFHSTNLFYYPWPPYVKEYDILFTSDSGILAADCTYINLFSQENDFRQMLFALFSLHVLLFHLPAYFLPLESWVRGAAYALPQLVFLEGAVLLLAHLLGLKRWDKAAFFLLANSSFPVLLFSLMQEQYVIAVFFLLLYLLLCRETGAGVLLAAAGGTLSSSAIALFLIPGETWRRRRNVLVQAILFGGGMALVTAKWGLIGKLIQKLHLYATFTGKGVPWANKWEQYLHFISSCFIAPQIVESDRTLQLAPPSGDIAWDGILIGALLICAYLLNRHDDRARLCFRWMLFSTFLLLVVGWGSMENGMVLYTLYFQWASCALLWLLTEKIFYGCPWGRRLVIGITAAGMLACNVPAIYAIWQWGTINYPTV
ncbi:MAG: hypothetical protein PHQ27_03295 [Victivallales bacterium]|nr:hypothetical protein [Victivallales bacterium]